MCCSETGCVQTPRFQTFGVCIVRLLARLRLHAVFSHQEFMGLCKSSKHFQTFNLDLTVQTRFNLQNLYFPWEKICLCGTRAMWTLTDTQYKFLQSRRYQMTAIDLCEPKYCTETDAVPMHSDQSVFQGNA